jgi:hypothetical protein
MEQHLESLYPETSRFEELEKIISFIKAGNSVQIVSIPGVGRSNLLGLLSYNRKARIKHLGEGQTKYHFVNINLSEVKTKSINDIFKFIFLELLDSLKERKIEQEYVSKILKDSISLHDEMVIFQGLKRTVEYLTLEKDLSIILLFDRFETFVSSANSEFFSNLRILRNRAKYKFSAVFSLNKPLEEVLEKETLGDFYEFVAGHVVYLPIFDKEGVDFRVKHLEGQTGKKIPKEKLEKVLELTGGHGKLTRVCLEYYLNKGLENYLEDKTVQAVLYGIENSLTPSDLKDLKAKNPNSYLESIGFLKNGKISIPLFEEFIKSHNPQGEFNVETASENLSLLEFKLLKFLTENPNRILGREDVINSVWSETKSQEGVTEAALDQLISRLRKKIEEDPNNPVHLLTVKGRGFKFVT